MARKIAQLEGHWQMLQIKWPGRSLSSKGFDKWFSVMAGENAQLTGLRQMIQRDGQGDCSAHKALANGSA